MKIYTNDLVKGHSDFKVKCLTFGLYTQVSDSGPLGPLVLTNSASDLLITGKIIKSQMHSKFYNLPKSYFPFSAEDEWTQASCRTISSTLVLNFRQQTK